MENSRHERAIVILASYVIGFTSAFIAFALHQSVESTVVTVYEPQPINGEQVAGVSAHTASIHIVDDGLVVVTEDGERLLSVRKTSPLAASVISSENVPGFAERIIEAELSRDYRFVYYCELLSGSADTCDAYVYDVETEIIHPVKYEGDRLSPSASNHVSYWLESGLLQIGNMTSISTETPWFVR